MRSRWLFAAFLLSLALAFLQHAALANFLYWHYPWFDVPMHYLGGVAVGTFLVALSPKFRPVSYVGVFAAIVVAWEIVEYAFGIPRESNYAFDTALDLLVGALGALTSYTIARFTVWRSS